MGGTEKGHETWRWCHDLLLTAARGKRAVNLLHHLCEVRAGVMRRGQQVLRCCDTDRKSREIEINAHPSTR